ncbi:hypothetical protein [Escherichia coli]|uniref:hypothetical protein n=1 Tax=Escherichia coli TaxID=562 RepID=UPI00311ACCEB
MIWQPEFTDKTLSRKPGAVHLANNQTDSLKLLAMIRLMKDKGRWLEDEIAEHQQDMLQVLLSNQIQQ